MAIGSHQELNSGSLAGPPCSVLPLYNNLTTTSPQNSLHILHKSYVLNTSPNCTPSTSVVHALLELVIVQWCRSMVEHQQVKFSGS